MIINGKRQWLGLHSAGVAYDSGWARVEFGETVVDPTGDDLVIREMTDQDRAKISDYADEWSANK